MGCLCGPDADQIAADLGKGGIVKKRACTDIHCVGIFGAFLVLWVIIAGIALENGDPRAIILPKDSEGNICGAKDYANKPYLFYFDATKCFEASLPGEECPGTTKMCVSDCPDELFTVLDISDANSLKNDIVYYADQVVPSLEEAPTDPLRLLIEGVKNTDGITKPTKLYCIRQAYASVKDAAEELLINTDPAAAANKLLNLVANDDCNAYTLPSSPIAHRCLPLPSPFGPDGPDGRGSCDGNCTDSANSTSSVNMDGPANFSPDGSLSVLVADLQQCIWIIVVMMLIAAAASFVWIVLMRFFAAPIIWTIVIGINALFIGATAYMAMQHQEFKENPVDNAGFLEKPKTWLTFLIICGIIAGIVLCITLFMIKRIRLATNMIGEATKAVGKVPTSMLFPAFLSVLFLLVFIWSGLVSAAIQSSAVPVFTVHVTDGAEHSYTDDNGVVKKVTDGESCDIDEWNSKDHALFAESGVRCQFDDLTADYPGVGDNLILVQLIHCFGFYWAFNLVVAIGQFVLAGTFSQWYWTQRDDYKHLSKKPVLTAMGMIMKNFGTLLFGSAIIAIINTLRAVLEYIERKTKKSSNKVLKAIFCCLKCCLWCMEKCMKFINKNAYIVCGIYGYNFCKSACTAFSLIMSNIMRFAAISAVTNMVIKLGVLVVTLGTTVLTFIIFDPSHAKGQKALRDFGVEDPEAMDNLVVVYVVVFLASYAIAKAFFLVYEMAVNTIFVCFLEDEKKNDGSETRPYFMSKSLRKLIS